MRDLKLPHDNIREQHYIYRYDVYTPFIHTLNQTVNTNRLLEFESLLIQSIGFVHQKLNLLSSFKNSIDILDHDVFYSIDLRLNTANSVRAWVGVKIYLMVEEVYQIH